MNRPRIEFCNNAGGVATVRPGFLAKPNRINVAISRAMDRLVLVGTRARWSKDGPMDRIAKAFDRIIEPGDGIVVDAAELLEASSSLDSDPDMLELAR